MGGYGKSAGKLDFVAGFSPAKTRERIIEKRSGELSLV